MKFAGTLRMFPSRKTCDSLSLLLTNREVKESIHESLPRKRTNKKYEEVHLRDNQDDQKVAADNQTACHKGRTKAKASPWISCETLAICTLPCDWRREGSRDPSSLGDRILLTSRTLALNSTMAQFHSMMKDKGAHLVSALFGRRSAHPLAMHDLSRRPSVPGT